jgi:hypothetical protein
MALDLPASPMSASTVRGGQRMGGPDEELVSVIDCWHRLDPWRQP